MICQNLGLYSLVDSDQMSGTFYRFTCVTVLSELFFGKTVLTFSFHFLSRLLQTKMPLLQTNLIVLERILVVSEIVTKPNTVYRKTFKHLIYFLYLTRLIFLKISNCDQTESHKIQGKKSSTITENSFYFSLHQVS